MMKSWRLLCFLVLAVSSLSRGQEDSTKPPDKDDENTTPPNTGPRTEANRSTPSSPVLHSNTPENGTTRTTLKQDEDNTFHSIDGDTTESAINGNGTAGNETTTSASSPESLTTKKGMKPSPVPTMESPKTTTTQHPGTADEQEGSSWAYVILALIIMVIIVLCVILYFLRRVSRSYSFDLQRPVQTNRLDEPIGTFEQVYLDDLDPPAPKEVIITDDQSPAPVANGTTLPSEEKMSNGENASQSAAPEDQLDEIDVESLPSDHVSPPPDDEQADIHSSNSTNLFFDAAGEDLNENNNNNDPSVCSSDPFVEINLDDPALCDQLLTPPVTSPFVLPFSPFSFSSTSLT